MTGTDLYPYGSGDLLNDRNVYSYSLYHGAPFLKAWAKQRSLATEASRFGRDLDLADTPTLLRIRSVRDQLDAAQRNDSAWQVLDRLLQRFEVTKRVHHDYADTWRAVDKTQFHAMPAYIELAETFVWAFQQTGQLTYLNVLLKMMDTLSSVVGDLPDAFGKRVGMAFQQEARFVEDLKATVQATPAPTAQPLPEIAAGETDMSGTVLLACSSARSRAYLEALCHFGMAPRDVLIMGPETDAARGPETADRFWNGMFMPGLQMSLSELCEARGIPVTHLPERDVNAQTTLAAVSDLKADLVIYSGVGGQIVSKDVLSAGPPFLHMHSGWLPDYRGSTTFYYSMLNRDLPSVSAIRLDPGIDTGPIFKRQAYPMPDGGMNVDLLYDTAIRADLLCRVLPQVLDSTANQPELEQTLAVGTTYYEIHPVLKHIALLSLCGEPM